MSRWSWHEVLLTRLRAAGEIEWSRAVADSTHVQAKKGCRDQADPPQAEELTAVGITFVERRAGARASDL